ncbi:hypothetical protein Purlil1_13431 [Purpureocillium lilacinum]|uniref:NAD/NADP octopine/nopaline dehydrogenase n=1 Tax=Purpureocillium lilacinum TaxID=33203 RepID=A0ABR0BE39_PURLI|nr:hypothetical protein Purlil1_13431 [Purpureocillium lilacinum]
MSTVAVIGAGHVGCALAFDLVNRGHKVTLRWMPGHPGNSPIINNNGNVLECCGMMQGRQPIGIVEGVSDVASNTQSVIIVAVPSQGHDDVLAALANRDLHNVVVVFITGNAVSVKALQILNAKAVFDTATSPYSSRVDPNGRVVIRGFKKRLQIGPAAPDFTTKDRIQIGELFNVPLEWSSKRLETFFSGVNGVVHVPAALLNLGWIESTGGDFFFYRQGMSSSVCRIIEAADRERLAVAKAYGCQVSSVLDTYNQNYGSRERTFRDFANSTQAHNQTKGAQKRFLSQDVPYWLVLCSDFGKKAKVPTPVIDMLVLMTSVLHDMDYSLTGRTIASLGLKGASLEKITMVSGAGHCEEVLFKDLRSRSVSKLQLSKLVWHFYRRLLS